MSQHIHTQYGIAPAQNIFLGEWLSANMLYISAAQCKEEVSWNMLVWNVNHSSIKSCFYVEGLLESEMNCKECSSVRPNSVFLTFLTIRWKSTFLNYIVLIEKQAIKTLLCCCTGIRNRLCFASVKFYGSHHSCRLKDKEWYLHYNMSFLKITGCNCDITVSKWNQQTFRVSDGTWRNKTNTSLCPALFNLAILWTLPSPLF